jgi:hypothetical protein
MMMKSDRSSCNYSELVINLWKVICAFIMKDKVVMLAKQIDDLGLYLAYMPFLKTNGVRTV